ncbi:hypothetical protein OXB_1710 [Bacillus sp. OxB-1]|uniref:hypothetical protein n=1 Tax=Bacillus sp. (strain OxB-1) TaxID=98228 RepID=UPI000581FF95|nr:hypothetical protein [Bacillus sp. OxB-1]BAQ10181.1 hypothetical protein OXB_1710 [Bacillus sp. OxB-1]
MKKVDKGPTSFLVPMWEWVFTLLEKLSVFSVVRKIAPKKIVGKYWFVDAWVIGNLLLAFASVYIVSYEKTPSLLVYIIVAYGILRVFEIFIYQMNVLLVHPFKGTNKTSYTLHSYRRMIVALIHNFFEIIFWFATTYVAFQFTFEHSLERLNPVMIVYYSFVTMVSYTSHLDKSSWTLLATTILHFQAIIGLFMTVISLARFVSLFPKPETLDDWEKEYDIYNNIQRIEQQLEEMNTKLDAMNRANDKPSVEVVNDRQPRVDTDARAGDPSCH